MPLLKEQMQNSESEEDIQYINNHIDQHQEQIKILNESTKQNLQKRQQMKMQLFEYYQQIRSMLSQPIENGEVRDYLKLVIKNKFLESQNVQLLLNLQLQTRTIMDLKNMIMKQQRYIEEHDIGAGQPLDMLLDLDDDADEEETGEDNEAQEEPNQRGPPLTDASKKGNEQPSQHEPDLGGLQINGMGMGQGQAQRGVKTQAMSAVNAAFSAAKYVNNVIKKKPANASDKPGAKKR